MILLLANIFALIMFFFSLYLSFTKPRALLKKKTKSFYSQIFYIVFLLNMFYMAGFRSGQEELVERGVMSSTDVFEFEYGIICFIPAILMFISEYFIIPFAKGRKEGMKEKRKMLKELNPGTADC